MYDLFANLRRIGQIFLVRDEMEYTLKGGFQVDSVLKNPPALQELGRRYLLNPRVLKNPWWRTWQPTPEFNPLLGNPMERGAWQATVHGVAQSCT